MELIIVLSMPSINMQTINKLNNLLHSILILHAINYLKFKFTIYVQYYVVSLAIIRAQVCIAVNQNRLEVEY